MSSEGSLSAAAGALDAFRVRLRMGAAAASDSAAAAPPARDAERVDGIGGGKVREPHPDRALTKGTSSP